MYFLFICRILIADSFNIPFPLHFVSFSHLLYDTCMVESLIFFTFVFFSYFPSSSTWSVKRFWCHIPSRTTSSIPPFYFLISEVILCHILFALNIIIFLIFPDRTWSVGTSMWAFWSHNLSLLVLTIFSSLLLFLRSRGTGLNGRRGSNVVRG